MSPPVAENPLSYIPSDDELREEVETTPGKVIIMNVNEETNVTSPVEEPKITEGEINSGGVSTNEDGETENEGAKVDGAEDVTEAKPKAEELISFEKEVVLPTGKLGITFKHSPPVIVELSKTSPIAEKVKLGQVVQRLVLSDGSEFVKMDAHELGEVLRKNMDDNGRTLVLLDPEDVGKVALPSGSIGVTFSGAVPTIKKIKDGSPLAGKVKEGQIITKFFVQGELEMANMTSKELGENLRKYQDKSSRVIVVEEANAITKRAVEVVPAPVAAAKGKPMRVLFFDLTSTNVEEVEGALVVLLEMEISGKKTAPQASVLVSKGATTSVLSALRNHVNVLSVEKNGLKLLLEMTTLNNVECNETVNQLGGAQTIVQVMDTYADDLEIQTTGVELLLNLSTGHKDLATSFVETGGIRSVVAAMNAFEEESSIQSFGCKYLTLVGGYEKDWAKRIREENGLKAISNVLKSYGGSIAKDAKAAMKLHLDD